MSSASSRHVKHSQVSNGVSIDFITLYFEYPFDVNLHKILQTQKTIEYFTLTWKMSYKMQQWRETVKCQNHRSYIPCAEYKTVRVTRG